MGEFERELIGGEIGYQGNLPGGKFGILIGLFLDLCIAEES